MNEKEWEGEMSTEFDRRVRDLHEAPLSFDQVRGKAVKIQRKRRAVVAGGVLAAAAVIVPVAVAAANGLGDATPREIAPATQTTSATDVATPETPAAPADPGALGIDYLEGRTFHRADGTAVELPAAYQSATRVGDLVYAGGYDERAGANVVYVYDADGEQVDSFEPRTIPVSDASGEVAAYVDADGDLVAVWGDGEQSVLTSGQTENLLVIAVTGGPTCEPGSDCRVWVDDQTVEDGQRVVTADGDVEPLPDGVLSINEVNDDGVAAVLTSIPGDQESCGGLFDLETATYLVESCDYSFLGVSPDGRFADVTHPYLDGIGNGWAAILDRDGTEVARFAPAEGGFTGDQVWQDDEHLLVVTYDYQAQEWGLVRLGVDGSQEVVAGPVRAPAEEPPYRF